MASWREASGRERGPDGYRFGDLTKTIVGKVVRRGGGTDDAAHHKDLASIDAAPKTDVPLKDVASWREASGRETGPDGYRFGDLTKTIVGKVVRRVRGDSFEQGAPAGLRPRASAIGRRYGWCVAATIPIQRRLAHTCNDVRGGSLTRATTYRRLAHARPTSHDLA